MNEPRLSLFALLAVLAIPLSAQTTITFSSTNPAPGQAVTATIHSTWPDSCVPANPTVAIIGSTVAIEARVGNCANSCANVVTDYTVTATFILSSAGVYNVDYYTVDCSDRHVLQTSAQLSTTGVSCDFPHSLRITPTSVRVGENIVLRWCDPTSNTPDNSFTVTGYGIYYSKTPDGPFVQLQAIQGANNTSVQYTSSSTDIGDNYFYAEARGCTSTTTGQCVPATKLTNIVHATVSANTGCAPNATTLCLGNGRFQLTARWGANSTNGDARPVQLTKDSGYFWFFNEDNVEITVKVLDACSFQPPAYWVFASGMTNVQVQMTVTDTLRNVTKTYTNPAGTTFVTKLDTNAFSCP